MGKKVLLKTCFLFFLMTLLIGCGKNKVKDVNSTDSNLEESVSNEMTAEVEEFSQYTKDSLIASGNNYRVSKAIEKLESGEEVTIAYLGGSITEGYLVSNKQNYPSQLTSSLKELFQNDNIINVNAGLSGTSSTIGLMRVENDVLSYEPDVIVIEFAVNDAKNTESMVAYDSLIKQCLLSEREPAVILLFTVTEDGYTCEEQMKTVGEAYELPMISINTLLSAQLKEDMLDWNDYAKDEVHPSYNGHKMIADCLLNYFVDEKELIHENKIDEELDYLKTSAYGASYYPQDFYNSLNLAPDDLGGFEEGSSNITHFPNGWIWSRNENKVEPFTFTITGTNVFLLYKEDQNDNIGNMEIYIDGNYKKTVYGNSSTGWNNPQATLLFSSDTMEDHTITIIPEEGSEDKIFHILGISVNGSIEGSFDPIDEASLSMEERSIIEEGNTTRLKNVFEKLKDGETVTIGFIGGSITQGTGASTTDNTYVSRVSKWFSDTFENADITFINAGIGATTSQYACARLDQDLLSYEPDLVFVEFSVNDENSLLFQETYESLIRKILISNNDPAVITLNMVQYDTGVSAEQIHGEVAKYYDLAQISMKESIYREIVKGNLKAEDISEDMLHPNDNGHLLVATMINYYLNEEKSKFDLGEDVNDYSIPDPMTELYSINSTLYQNKDLSVELNGFQKDTNEKTGITDLFKLGWYAKEEGDSMTFEVSGSHITLLYKRTVSGKVPMAEVIIDGEEENPILLDGNYEDGWGNWLYLDNIYDGEEDVHKITIRLRETNTTDFYLVGIITR